MKTETKYDVDYFIRKFETLTNIEVGSGSLHNYCALWHCGCREVGSSYTSTEESSALIKILGGTKEDFAVVFRINDEAYGKYQQAHPRQRILAALYDIKRMREEKEPNKIEESQPKVEYKLVYSDQKVKDLTKEELIMN